MFSILQWNCRGFFSRLAHIKMLVTEHSPDLCCLQETKLKPGQIPSFANFDSYNFYHTDNQIASGGTSILIKKSYYSEPINISTSLQAVAVKVWFREPVAICNVYIPPDYSLTQNDISTLIGQLPTPYILVGDFNSHNRVWGSDHCNNKGKVMEHILTNENISLLNTGAATYFCSYTGKLSHIDLSLCDPKSFPSLSWQVLDDLHDSDHFPIKISTLDNSIERHLTINKWRINSADWTSFQQSISSGIQQFRLSDSIEQTVSDFNQIIISAAEKYVGRTNFKAAKKYVPWWNKKCADSCEAAKKALNLVRKCNTEENRLEYKRLKAISRKTVKDAKRDSWRAYVSSLTADTPMQEVWNKVKRIKGITATFKVGALKDSAGNILTDTKDIADQLARNIYNQSSDENYSNAFQTFKNATESKAITYQKTDDHIINTSITEDELRYAINTTRNASPGPDDIPAIFLKNLPETALTQLLAIYNQIWKHQVYPKIWQSAVILPIHKSGKTRLDASSYRPISLTCTMGKILEKIVNKRLLWFLESKAIINENQSGFRSNRSTIDNLAYFQAEILEAFAQNQELIAVYFDVERAFDTTWRHKILMKLLDWGLQGNVYAFISNFLSNRAFRVRLNGVYSEQLILKNGVPQGSVISPTLFLIAVNDLQDYITRPVKLTQYADDLLIFCRGKHINTTAKLIQKSIDSLEIWSKENGLKFSSSKTSYMKFTRRRHSQNTPIIKLQNLELNEVLEQKFLGMTFDQKLTWQAHINHLKANCLKRLNLMKSVAYHHWGAQERVLLTLYRSLIRPKIDYGSTIYASAGDKMLRSLDVVVNSALRIATGAFRTSPIQSLYRECGEPPLWIRRQELQLCLAARISTNNKNPVYPLLFDNGMDAIYDNQHRAPRPFVNSYKSHHIPVNLQDTYPINSTNSPPWTMCLPICDTTLLNYPKENTPPEMFRQFFTEAVQKHRCTRTYYTDGSKSEGGVGCSVINDNTISKFHLPSICSIHTAELYAILKAVQAANQTLTRRILVCSDSLSSVQSISTLHSPDPLVVEILEALKLSAEQGKTVIFMWIPSHCGITGNEEADAAAREATSTESVENIQLHYDVISHIKASCKNTWQSYWSTLNNKLQLIEPTIQFKRLPRLSRREEVVMRRLRIGHSNLTHRFLLDKQPSPMCTSCEEQMSVCHFLSSCRATELQRRQYLGDRDLQQILSLSGEETENVLKFLRVCNLFNLL